MRRTRFTAVGVRMILSAWSAIIKTGNPNCKELPAWEPFNPDENPTMVLDNIPELKKNHDAMMLEYWCFIEILIRIIVFQ